jgi:hypothetical protein
MRARLLLAGAVMVAAAGCGGGDQRASTPTPTATPDAVQEALDVAAAGPPDVAGDDESDVAKLVRARAELLAAGEPGRLAATARGAQRARDRRAARRVRRIGLRGAAFTVEDTVTARRTATIKGKLRYRVRGLDRPSTIGRRITARKRGGRWFVVSDRPRRELLPWEVARFRAVRTRHIVLLAADGVATGELRSGLERAYRRIRRDLPRRELPRSVLVLATRDHAQAERFVGGLATGVIALANVRAVWGSAPALPVERVLSQRMVVIDETWRPLSAEQRQGTLVHEMTHTALQPETSARTPPWLIEGVAMYLEGDRGPGVRTPLSRISRPGSIYRLEGSAQGDAYAASAAAAFAIAERHGSRGLFRLFDAFNDREIPGRPGARTTDRVLRRTLGMSLAELEAAIGS